ncbi:hypothetical protein [Streptomyces laurentii]|uniref:hypothetical protein n=1 Tax=Streptomyces laurentii TaxID=39478 RepID=UPI0036CBDE3B
MIKLVPTRTLRALHARLSEAETAAEAARASYERIVEWNCALVDSVDRAEEVSARLRAELCEATAGVARLEGELETLRAQSLLDTEDRQALRTLLRATRKQNARADRVFVLLRFGDLHSVHATRDAAEIAAEAEGAPRSGWFTPSTHGETPAPAAGVPWVIRPVPLGGTQ